MKCNCGSVRFTPCRMQGNSERWKYKLDNFYHLSEKDQQRLKKGIEIFNNLINSFLPPDCMASSTYDIYFKVWRVRIKKQVVNKGIQFCITSGMLSNYKSKIEGIKDIVNYHIEILTN